jgi:hypothetical protein
MELSEHFVDFEKRSSIKSQVIADFIAEWTEPSSYTEGPVPESSWMIYCDRAWGKSEPKWCLFYFTVRNQAQIRSEAAIHQGN